MWDCPKCHAKVDPSFEVCWQCGTSRDGVEDPSFISADETGPIDDPVRDHPLTTPDVAFQELSGIPLSELTVCYEAYNLVEAKFLADQLIEAGIPAISNAIDDNAIYLALERPRIYVRSEDHDRARVWLEEFEERRKREHSGTHKSS